MRCKAVAWHPKVATQLCLASEDDQLPVIQLWDLRQATAPLNTFEGHSKGILSIDWCSQVDYTHNYHQRTKHINYFFLHGF